MVTIQDLAACGAVRRTNWSGKGHGTIMSPVRGAKVEFAYHGKHRRGLIDAIDFGCKTITIEFVDASGEKFYRQFRFEKIHNFRVLSVCPS